MNYIQDLLPQTRLVQLESASRDKRHKNKSRYQSFTQESLNQEQADKIESKEVIWADIERRSGDDRRQNAIERGRWLESRAKKDRRKVPELYVRI